MGGTRKEILVVDSVSMSVKGNVCQIKTSSGATESLNLYSQQEKTFSLPCMSVVTWAGLTHPA